MKKTNINHLVFGLIAIAAFILYRRIFFWLVSVWLENPDYSHGFVIPMISGYIIWQKREKLKRIMPAPSRSGLLVLSLGLFLEIASVRAGVNFTAAYSFMIVLLGIVLYWWGKEMAKELLFPIGFLFFMIPFSVFLINPISYKLKLLSSYLSAEVVQLMDIPLYREGVIIYLANGALEVADPCSGIRSLMGFLMLGTLFAYFASGSVSKKIFLFSVTVPFVIMGNTFRIVCALLFLHFWELIIANTHWETALGVIIVMLIASGLLFTGRLLNCQISDLSK